VDGKPRGVAMANLLDWRARSTLFDSMAVYQPRSFGLTLSDGGAPIVIQTAMVMPDFFRVLSVAPSMGRVFGEEDQAIVLTDRLSHRLFPAGAIGRRVWLNEEPHTVIGVMPAGFEFPIEAAAPEAFIPISRKDYCCNRLGLQGAIARLKPGVTLAQGRAELEALAAGLAVEYPETNRGRTAGLLPLADALTSSRREPLLLLIAASALLLAIACSNVAGLMLARYLGRSHEIWVRISLGAGPFQLVRQFLAEAGILTLASAGCGLGAALAVLQLIPRFVPTSGGTVPRLDGASFAFAIVTAIAVTGLLTAVPLKLSHRHRRGGTVLVAAQVALSLVLLLATGLLLRSLLHIEAVNPGFETAHALRFGIGLPEKRYDTERKLIDFHRELLRRLLELPGVEQAGAAARLPLRGGAIGGGSSFQIAGANIPIPQRPRAGVNTVSPGYFQTMGTPLLDGREFSYVEDRPSGQRVAIVNEAFTRAYLRGHRAVGTPLDIRGSVWEIIGVAADTHQAGLDREPVPEIFLSLSQTGADGCSYVIRFKGDAAGLPQTIGATVAQLDPRLQRVSPEALSLVVERNLGSRRMALRLIGGFGVLALMLMSAGVYGIVSFRAAARSHELAVRVALGATAGDIRRLVFGQGMRLTAAGAGVGLAGFLIVEPLLRSQLYGVTGGDPAVLAPVVGLVFAIAMGACFGPSRRAARAAPMDLLRERPNRTD
jgi:putative ABC transport system permease protein